MTEVPSRQKLSDDQVRAIFTTPGTLDQVAAALGLRPCTVAHYRWRRSKRAIRIARELGLLGPKDTLRCWASDGSETTATARQVAR